MNLFELFLIYQLNAFLHHVVNYSTMMNILSVIIHSFSPQVYINTSSSGTAPTSISNEVSASASASGNCALLSVVER